jgi:hypothetical protein
MEAIMNVSRRAVLTAIPAFAIPSTSSLANGSDAELIALERQWLHLQSLMSRRGLADEEGDALWEMRDDIEEKIFATPAHSMDGLLVKARRTAYWAEESAANELFPHLLDDMQRLAGAS